MNNKIIFLGGGTRVSHIEYFRRCWSVYTTDTERSAPSVSVADGTLFTPHHFSEKEFMGELASYCIEKEITFLLPSSHHSLGIKNIDPRFVYLSVDGQDMDRCLDKGKSLDTFRKLGVGYTGATPRYPKLGKPRYGSGSHGIVRVENACEEEKLDAGEYVITEYIGDKWREFSVDVLTDKDCRPIYIVPRYRQVVGSRGEVVKSETFRNADIREDLLKIIDGFRLKYISCVQGFLNPDTGERKYFEVNPRFGGGCTLSIAAGADIPRVLLDHLNSISTPYSEDWTSGLVMNRAYRDFYFNRGNSYLYKAPICIDFDGTLTNQGGGPNEDMVGFTHWAGNYFRIYIYSARTNPISYGLRGAEDNRREIRNWLNKNGILFDDITDYKIPGCVLYIDDRSFRWTGKIEDLMGFVKSTFNKYIDEKSSHVI